MRRMLRYLKWKKPYWLVNLILILLIGFFAWQGIHKTPSIPDDVYPYLTSLPGELILEAQNEGNMISTTGWADTLAIKSTLSPEQAQYLLAQLKSGTPFKRLLWQTEVLQLREEQIKQVKRRREVLITYPFYEPDRFIFPVPGKIWYTDTFGADREGGARIHEGTDIFSAEGTPLISVCSGKVEKLGWNRLGGERVGVRGEDGNYYYYAHLQRIEPTLHIGQDIRKGDLIGTIGHTGDALTTPDHLHFGIELPNGEWINPYPFLYVWEQQKLAD